MIRWTLASVERPICSNQFISHQLSMPLCHRWSGACSSPWWWLLRSHCHSPLLTAWVH